MSIILSESSLQAERDVFEALSLEKQEKQRENLIAWAEALNNARNAQLAAELALRWNLRYIETKEWSDLPFKWIYQPLGVPEEHVKAMYENKERFPWVQVHVLDEQGSLVKPDEYSKSDTIPQFFQKRLTAETLKIILTDETEISRIEKMVADGKPYPLITYGNPPANQLYAEKYLWKRIFKDFGDLENPNEEARKFLEALPWTTIEDKFIKAGIPFLGVFNADYLKVVAEGNWADFASSIPHRDGGFHALWFLRHYDFVYDLSIQFYGSGLLVVEDIIR
jgi:hypothetical protein